MNRIKKRMKEMDRCGKHERKRGGGGEKKEMQKIDLCLSGKH